ncbi:Cro/C1-type helix-turn-helix domain [Candidatus Nanopelagicaceae bacterium]
MQGDTSIQILELWITPFTGHHGVYGALMNTNQQLHQVQTRLRTLREGRNLTLHEAAQLSDGEITAIALGSYERGDRAISASKLLKVAAMYGVPINELFANSEKSVTNQRTTLDIRKLKNSNTQIALQLTKIVSGIAKLRSDWNGEIISLRSEDLTNLSIFGGLSVDQIESIQSEFGIARSK